MAMARWQPAWVRALVLVATSPRFITAEDWSHAMTPAVLQQFGQQLQDDTMGTLRRFLALQVKGSETARQQLRMLNALLSKSGIPQALALQGGLKLLQETDLRAELLQIRSPALLCLGGHDTLVPAGMGRDCQRWWPTLRQVCIKPAALIPFLSHPDIFWPLLQSFFEESGIVK
jgi:pimeloyl-[acyl-carrier protein] methyl ester esterase